MGRKKKREKGEREKERPCSSPWPWPCSLAFAFPWRCVPSAAAQLPMVWLDTAAAGTIHEGSEGRREIGPQPNALSSLSSLCSCRPAASGAERAVAPTCSCSLCALFLPKRGRRKLRASETAPLIIHPLKRISAPLSPPRKRPQERERERSKSRCSVLKSTAPVRPEKGRERERERDKQRDAVERHAPALPAGADGQRHLHLGRAQGLLPHLRHGCRRCAPLALTADSGAKHERERKAKRDGKVTRRDPRALRSVYRAALPSVLLQ